MRGSAESPRSHAPSEFDSGRQCPEDLAVIAENLIGKMK